MKNSCFESRRFWESILEPLGLRHVGHLDRPRCFQERIKSAQDTPKSAQAASKTAPGARKMPPRPHQERPRCPKMSQDDPTSAQEASRIAPRAPKTKRPPRAPQERAGCLQDKTAEGRLAKSKHTSRARKVCGGTRDAAYNPPHTFRCASAFLNLEKLTT